MRVASWVWGAGVLLPIGGLAGMFLWPGSNASGPAALEAAAPIAQITAPPPGFKLREGRTMAVRVRVEPGDHPLQGWTLRLVGSGRPDLQLAGGVLPVDGQPVAEVAADDLTPGEKYELVLDVSDTIGAAAEAQLDFLVPDPQYTLIPLEPGNLSTLPFRGISVDGSGDVVSFLGKNVNGANFDVFILNSAAATLTRIPVPLASTDGQKLTENGKRFFFSGVANTGPTIDYFDLVSDGLVQGPPTPSDRFTTDRTGRWVAYQAQDPTIPDPDGNSGGSLQYFLYDGDAKLIAQLSHDAQAIRIAGDAGFCPQPYGTTPLINKAGTTVVLITSALLGLLPPDPEVGCYVFVYDISSGTTRYVRGLPKAVSLDVPALSDDGRWLSFVSSRIISAGYRQSFGSLLDLATGQLTDALGNIIGSPVYDAVISGDAGTVILSTTDDLDPRVGNADHNFELFSYDVATGQFTQISDTTGGISGGLCDSRRPAVNTDARVVLFTFSAVSAGQCQVAAPQRNGSDEFFMSRVRAIRKRPGNHSPVLHPIGDIRIEAGGNLVVSFSATDADLDPIVFFAQMVGGIDIPPGSAIMDHRDGTATLAWHTNTEQAGLYPMRVAAFDEGGGEVFQDFTIAVCRRIAEDASVAGVVAAIFGPNADPAECHTGELNRDGRMTAADIVKAASGTI